MGWPLSGLNPGGVALGTDRPRTYDTCHGCGHSFAEPSLTPKCERCLTSRTSGTMHGFTPSELPVERDRERRAAGERDARNVRHQFDDVWSKFTAALKDVEQTLRHVKLTAARIGELEEPLTGRAAVSTRDELLAPVRQRTYEALRRIETLI